MIFAAAGLGPLVKVLPSGAVSIVANANSGFLDQGRPNLAADAAGNLYAPDAVQHVVRKMSATGAVSDLAGGGSVKKSYADGPGASALFKDPMDVAPDASGNLYVADNSSHTLRKIDRDGTVSTLAGADGQTGSQDGVGAQARFGFGFMTHVAAGPSGTIYVPEFSGIRKITPQGVVSTIPLRFAVDTHCTGPIVTDADENLYVGCFNYTTGTSGVLMLTPAGKITMPWDPGTDPATTATLPIPSALGSMAIDGQRNLYATNGTAEILKFTAGGAMERIPGTATTWPRSGIAIDPAGIVYVAEAEPVPVSSAEGSNAVIRAFAPNGATAIVAGRTGTRGTSIGSLPGSFDTIRGISFVAPHTLAITTNAAVLEIVLR
jgi:hypothetical protein